VFSILRRPGDAVGVVISFHLLNGNAIGAINAILLT
jgi:hypothetical protein